MANSFYKKRLTTDKVIKYLSELYPDQAITLKEEHKIAGGVTPYLQEKYGLSGDCSLTCILTCAKYWEKGLWDSWKLYDEIEKIANKYFYNGNSYGTIPVFIKSIYEKTLKLLGINRKVKQAYFKGIGFNFKTIKQQIDNNVPVILSLFNDGRDYYSSHSVTIVGYMVYTINGKERVLLEVADNWYYYAGLIDYTLLSPISEITY